MTTITFNARILPVCGSLLALFSFQVREHQKSPPRGNARRRNYSMSGFKSPVELAKSACLAAKAKVAWSVPQMLVLGIMAGAYIAFGGWLMTVVTHDLAATMGVGFSRFLGGAIFSVGLMLVVIAGAELFTGNCMMPLSVMAGCTPMSGVLRNWFWVYVANFIGSILVAFIIYYSGLWKIGRAHV